MTVDQILSHYDRALNQDDGCARWALVCAVYALTGERWPWQVPPSALEDRLRNLSQRLNPSQRSLVPPLLRRLEHDLTLYIHTPNEPPLSTTWAQFSRDNCADLECETALAKLWRGAWWAPAADFMISLNEEL